MVNVPIPKTNADFDTSLHITKSTEKLLLELRYFTTNKLQTRVIEFDLELKTHLNFAICCGFVGLS